MNMIAYTLVPADPPPAQAVAEWRDISGNDHALSQADAEHQPVLVSTPPAQPDDEAIDDMARSFGETITEALQHIENLLDVADNCVVVDDEAREAVSAARKFWNEMNPPDKFDGADDPRYR